MFQLIYTVNKKHYFIFNCNIKIINFKLALTKTLEQITEEYRRDHEKRSFFAQDATLKRIKDSQDTGTSVEIDSFNNLLQCVILITKLVLYYINQL